MGKAQAVHSSIWSQEVARAVALQRHMPGIQQLQTQYVRYSGQSEAQQCDDGWILSASQAQVARNATPQTQQPSDSGAEGCMSTTGPTSSSPTTPRAGLGPPQAPAATAHASPSPIPFFDAPIDPFAGDADAMSVGAVPNDACCALGRGTDSITSTQLLQQVQLSIVNAPAEFCMPIKRDKRFRPNFQIEVRVVHQGSLHLPLRVGVFAVSQEDRDRILEWLPSELVPVMDANDDSDELTGSPPKRKKTSKANNLPLEERLRRRGLKTHTVLSHVFQSPDDTLATTTPATRSEHFTGPSDAGSSKARRAPFFPSSAASATGPPDPSIVELADSKSLMARSDDPELATRVKLGGVRNTMLAHFEYQRLEFEIPSEVTPVYLVFACLVGNKDLLYTLYTPPSVSMCRRDQQAKSLAVLGLPKNAMQQIEALKGTYRAAPVTPEDSAAPRTSHGTGVSTGATAPLPTAQSSADRRNDDSDRSSQALELGHQRTNKSAPASGVHLEVPREPFWARYDRDALKATMMPDSAGKNISDSKRQLGSGYGSSIPEDLHFYRPKDWERPSSGTSQSLSTQSRRWSNPPFLDNPNRVSAPISMAPDIQTLTERDVTLTGQCPPSDHFSAHLHDSDARLRHSDPSSELVANREPFWATTTSPLQVEDMKHMTLPSQASLDKGSSLDPWGNLSLPTAMHVDIAQKLTEDGTPQSGIRAPDPHLFAFSQHPSHTSSHPNTGYESGQLSIQMPLPIMPPCDPPHPSLFRNASDAMSVDDGGFSGGFSGRLPGFSGIPAIPAAPPMFSAHDSTGVAQAAVFSWTHQEYCAAGDLRDLTCVEARSLLSVAGFADARSGDPPSQGPALATGTVNSQFSTTQSSLLSLAGFPDLAGVDKNARISASQFAEFKGFFSATVASVRHVAALWNTRKPSCVLGGFDVNQARAAEALRPQPSGTFVCFFSLQGQFAGHLVIACKMLPAGEGRDSSAWQPQKIEYLAVNPEDIQAGNLESIIMGLSHATHALDVYTAVASWEHKPGYGM